MAQSNVLSGAQCKVYINGKLYSEVQGLSYTINYGEAEIYGIDSPFPQEIATTRTSVQGSINGLRIHFSGGLQGYMIRPRINEILHAPYTSLRILDRKTNIELLWLPQMKVVSETMVIQNKTTVKLNFNFKGVVPYNEIDMA